MKHFPQKSSDFDIANTNWEWPLSLAHSHWSNFPAFSQTPEISIWEEDKEVVVEVATPGVKPENIELTVEKGVLLIRAEKKEEKSDKAKKYYQKSSSSFVYRVSIPNEIDEKKEPKAVLKNGLLQVRFMKSERSIPKKITVHHQE